MIDSEYFAKDKVEYPDRKNGLPESDEVESEGNAPEDLVLLYCPYDTLAYIFGFENRNNLRLDAVKHTCIYIIRCNCSEEYIALSFLKLNSN